MTAEQEAESKKRGTWADIAESYEKYPNIPGMAGGMGIMPAPPPTSEQIKTMMSPYVYDPKTEREKTIAGQTELGGTWAALSPKSAVGTPFRIGAGAAMQPAGQFVESLAPGYGGFVPLAGMLAGELGAGAFSSLSDSEKRSVTAMKQAYDQDVRAGLIDPSKIDPNTPITDIPFTQPAKSALRKLVKQQSSLASDTSDLAEFNRTAKTPELRKKLVNGISSDIEDITGIPNNNALQAQQAINDHFNAEKSRLYDAAKSSVPGQAVPKDIFGGYENAPIVKTAEKQIQDAIANNPNNPRYRDVVMPTDTTPGNYSYYEQVYRQLRDSAFLKNANLPTDEINISNQKNAAQAIKNSLDKHMTVNGESLSGVARGTARDHFDASDIINVGEKFLNEEPTNASEAQASEKAFTSLKPDERAAATYGALNQFNKIISDDSKDGLSWAADKFNTDATFNRKMQMLLGKTGPNGAVDLSDYDALRGRVIAADIRSKIPAWDIDSSSPSFAQRHPYLTSAGIAGTVATGTSVAAEYLKDLAVNSSFMTTAGLAATGALSGLGLAAKSINDAAVKRAANDIILKMSTGNVRDLQALSQLTRTNPIYTAVYRGMNTALANQQVNNQNPQTRVGHAAGGRTGNSAQSKANRLIEMADRIKKEEGKTTQSLLNLDDTTIAKALAVANQHI